MRRELVAHGGTDGTGASAVDHAELVSSGEGGGVDERANRLAGLLRRAPRTSSSDGAWVGVEVRSVTAGSAGVSVCPSRSGRSRSSGTRTRRPPRPRRRPRHARSRRWSRGRRARRDDRIAGGERGRRLERLVRRAERAPRARGALGRRAEAPVALPLLRDGTRRRRCSSLALETARGADLGAESLELGARPGELELRVCERTLPLCAGGGAHAPDLRLELRYPRLGSTPRLFRRSALPRRALALPGCLLLGGLRLGEELGDAPPLRRDMPGGVLDHLGRKAETRRDAEGVGRAGAPERDAVERLLRLGSKPVAAFAASGDVLAHSLSSW